MLKDKNGKEIHAGDTLRIGDLDYSIDWVSENPSNDAIEFCKKGEIVEKDKKYEPEEGMKEILFRGKLVYNGTWVYGGFYKEPVNDIKEGLSYIITASLGFAGNANNVQGKTVCQFTNLFDKDSNKIFEGDMLERKITKGWISDPIVGVVVFYEGGFKLKYHSYGSNSYDDIVPFTYQQYESNCSSEREEYEYTVVGNIYDNPELLEEV